MSNTFPRKRSRAPLSPSIACAALYCGASAKGKVVEIGTDGASCVRAAAGPVEWMDLPALTGPISDVAGFLPAALTPLEGPFPPCCLLQTSGQGGGLCLPLFPSDPIAESSCTPARATNDRVRAVVAPTSTTVPDDAPDAQKRIIRLPGAARARAPRALRNRRCRAIMSHRLPCQTSTNAAGWPFR